MAVDVVDWEHLAVGIRAYFDRTILNRGWTYFLNDAVSQIEREGAQVKARVSGTKNYKVTIDLNAFMRSRCSCPYGSYCKHIAAVLFETAELDGYDPKAIKEGILKSGPKPVYDLTPKPMIKLPSSSGSCEDWVAYFNKQYGSSRVVNAFGIEEVMMRAWGELNKLADEWERTIRDIYDLQVLLFLMRLGEKLSGQLPEAYDFYYQIEYYSMRIVRHHHHQLNAVLSSIDVGQAQRSYSGHLKELGDYTAHSLVTRNGIFERQWLETYKLLWLKLLVDEGMAKAEEIRLRQVLADPGVSPKVREEASIKLVHFEIKNGEDENAWERIAMHGDEVEFEDWQSYLVGFIQQGEWDRLVRWLRWFGTLISSQQAYSSDAFFSLWHEASKHIDVETEYRDVMVKQLPGSYRYYAHTLLMKEEYGAWVDLCLAMNLSPMHLENSDLKLVEKADVRVLLPLYHYAAESSIQGRTRADYKQAVKELKKLSTLYKKLKQTPRFEAYIQKISKQYSRFRAFQEELRKGKLIL